MKIISFILLLSGLFFFQFLNVSAQPSTQGIKYLALGDSYTVGQSVRLGEKFPFQLASRLEADGIMVDTTILIAQSGWRTDVLLNAITNANLTDTFDLVSLLIGVNNQFQKRSPAEYKIEFKALLDSAIVLAGGIKEHVFVLSIPDYGFTPFGQPNQTTISAELKVFNEICELITKAAGVKWFNITPISKNGLVDPSLVARDGLHPSGKMYKSWVELFYYDVKNSLY